MAQLLTSHGSTAQVQGYIHPENFSAAEEKGKRGLTYAILFVLSVFFRKIIIMQLVGLVLTDSFTNCDFGKIRDTYENIIYFGLKRYMKGTKSTQFNPTVSCYNPSECLTIIDRDTFTPTHGCESFPTEDFSEQTRATLASQCPGYSRTQTNSAQKMKTKEKEVITWKCLEKAAHLLGLWRRFSRF
ncbi:thymic stromal lymphopoietin [Ochotona curzoniae]|uniref:thymic stromal lymphopoietin n=1 Tax=Ochotona curzoniae TaxID=130825 RepID=UPI001B3480C5|nr:thymic stromal lymphopoietin [Ochotona curzoniae]